MVKIIKILPKRKFQKAGNSVFSLVPDAWKALVGFEKPNGEFTDEYIPYLLKGKHGYFIGIWGEFQKKKVI